MTVAEPGITYDVVDDLGVDGVFGVVDGVWIDTRPVCIRDLYRHPANVHHDHLDRLFYVHPSLHGLKCARLAETLIEHVRWGA